MKNEGELLTRWTRCIELSAKMAEDERVRKGTRYDALRIIPMDPSQAHLNQLKKYLSSSVDGELQMGSVSGLSDIELPVVAVWLRESMANLKPTNRRLAIEALGRNDDRLAALLDAMGSGLIKSEEVPAAVMEKLNQTKNPALRLRQTEAFKTK